MDTRNYSLRELSDELDISLRDLRKHIGNGTLRASRVGKKYMVSSTDIDDFIANETEIPQRNYLCRNYDKCLDKAARGNRMFDCDGCKDYMDAGKNLVIPLWGSVFGAEARCC